MNPLNSMPLLTGDVLFQQRIDKCMTNFTWALGQNDINGLVGMYSAANGLFIDLSYYLDKEQTITINDKLKKISSILSRAIEDKHNKSISEVLDLSRECMNILITKAHEKGFIVSLQESRK